MADQANLHRAAHMRVLAHPTRLKLLALLREHGPQTAALLARYVEEAPGSLSYHLRKLASADLIEEAADAGTDARERWWRATHAETVWDTAEFASDPERLAAQQDMYRALGQAYAQRLAAYIDGAGELDRSWLEAGFLTDRSLRLTPGQLGQLGSELEALQERWLSVSRENIARPEGNPDAADVFFLAQGYRQP
ncbi:MAG: helix-turn-helix domain-containing protein [Leucobacter sp.]